MEKQLTITITIQQMKVIDEALQRMPFNQAAPVIFFLQRQCEQQLKDAEVPNE